MAAPAEYEDVPLTSMRRTIGKRLLESTQQLPHFYATAEINMGESFQDAEDEWTKEQIADI